MSDTTTKMEGLAIGSKRPLDDSAADLRGGAATQRLSDLLATRRDHSYATQAAMNDFANPGLFVPSIGTLALPCVLSDIQRVIQQCAQAPFGRGERTLVDTSVRKTWQLEPTQFRLQNPAWQQTLATIVSDCRGAMGVRSAVEAKLYKLLIYEEGGKFEPHCDTEKERGMFATLVIVLPGSFEGGELVIRHDSQECRFDAAKMSQFALKYAAFYADCEHQVLPVTKGYRVCLTYNLIASDADEVAIAALEHVSSVSAGLALVKAIVSDDKTPKRGFDRWAMYGDSEERPVRDKLAYVLEHRYTTTSLGFAYLKGHDRDVADYLRSVCEASNGELMVYMCLAQHVHKSHAEHKYEIGSLLFTSSPWSTPDGSIVELKVLPSFVVDVEVLPIKALKKVKYDKTKAEDTGNEGVRLAQWYSTAALVVLTKKLDVQLRVQALPFKQGFHMLKDLVAGKDPMVLPCAQALVLVPPRGAPQTMVHEFLELVPKLGDPTILVPFVRWLGFYELDDIVEAAIRGIGWEECSDEIRKALDGMAPWKNRLAVGKRLIGLFPKKSSSYIDALVYDEDCETECHRLGDDDTTTKPPHKPMPTTIEEVAEMFHVMYPCSSHLQGCVQKLSSVDLYHLMIPGFVAFVKSMDAAQKAEMDKAGVVRTVYQYVQRDSPWRPKISQVTCFCEHCKLWHQFARDMEQTEQTFNGESLDHLENAIKEHVADIMSTSRPSYSTLVVRKTQQYADQVALFRSAVAELGSILPADKQ